MYPKVAQISYSSEKRYMQLIYTRFLCPQPILMIFGDAWDQKININLYVKSKDKGCPNNIANVNSSNISLSRY